MARQADQLIKPGTRPDGVFHNAGHVEAMKAMMDPEAGESEVRRVAAAYDGSMTPALKLNLAYKAWRELTE